MRAVALALLLAGVASCRRYPPPETSPQPPRSEPPAAARGPAERRAGTTSPSTAAIVDSIRRAVRDSIESEGRRGANAAAARDSAERAALRDSLEAAARRDSIAATARRDSLAADAARRDSIAAAARRDSIAAAVRRDSIAAVRADSIATAALDSIAAARADSIAAAIADSIAAARDAAPSSSDRAPPAAEVEELRALGPAFIPYDEGPRPIWDTDTQATLTKTLLPVLRREGLEARTRTIFWALISPEGEVVELVPQTSSGSEAFDEAAASFARQLRFRPALRGGRPVAVWVLREVSIVMQ